MFFWLQQPPNLTWMFPHATDKDDEATAADDETAAPVFIAYVETPYPLQPLTLLFRFVFLFIIYMPLLLTLPFWVLSERWTGQESGLRRPWIKALCWVMELSGPTFIKVFFYLLCI